MMSSEKPQCWDIDREASFAEISSWCVKRRQVNRLIVSVRSALDINDRREFDPRIEHSVARIFGKNIIRTTFATAWPGTMLIGHVGKVYVIAFDMRVQRRMSDVKKHLSGWKQSNNPPLPEDICLYREGDAWPVLVSVTNDGDAWLLDDKPDADFIRVSEMPLPADLVPPRPDFIAEAMV